MSDLKARIWCCSSSQNFPPVPTITTTKRQRLTQRACTNKLKSAATAQNKRILAIKEHELVLVKAHKHFTGTSVTQR